MRVVIDTNIWISALLNPSGEPARLVAAFMKGEFELVVCEPLVKEIAEVLRRPRIAKKYQLNDEQINSYCELITQQAIWVDFVGSLRLCRDPRDDFLLEAALWSSADYLVTRDDDLKQDHELVQLMREMKTQIVSMQQFLNLLRDGTS